MPAHVRSDVRQLFPIDLVVAIHRMVESVLPVHRHFRHAILVQIQKPCVTANHLLYPRCFPVLQDRLKAAEYFLCHGELSCACICLGRLDHVLHFGGPLQLLVDVDDPLLHIEIVDGQSTELRDSHSCMEQYVECSIIYVSNKSLHQYNTHNLPKSLLIFTTFLSICSLKREKGLPLPQALFCPDSGNPLNCRIYRIFQPLCESNTTVSTASTYGNISTGTAFFISYPPSVKIARSLASVVGSQDT